jgi:shikimate dehydrogenase
MVRIHFPPAESPANSKARPLRPVSRRTMISGRTTLVAHLGYPTESFKAPMIYNPWFERKGIDAVVVPMGVGADDYPAFLRLLFRLSNILGALVTMPHKATTVALLDEVSLAVKIAGSCNAILRHDDRSLYGDMFDGEGFTRGAKRRGFDFADTDCLVVGAGGVGSAIAASIAAQRPRSLAIFDTRRDAVESLVARLRRYYPDLAVEIRNNDPAGYHLVVNRPRSACDPTIRCRSTRSGSIAKRLSARWCCRPK